MINYAHVIVDLQAGDTGKGKVAHSLLKTNQYTHVIRYNGGGNAGHTVYHNGKKVVTHFVPMGVLYNVKSIIGPGCVVDPVKLKQEIKELESLGFNIKENLFIDKRTHIITEEYKIEDSQDTTIGTTKTGNGPTYRNKYNRTGIRAENCEELKELIIDIYEELHGLDQTRILFEGAQGFELDVDWGDYPYVTSSHCTVGSAIMNGVPPQKILKIYGTAKAYKTYVGNKKFEIPSEIFSKMREIGQEYGATTGRPRQIGWMNINDMIRAININGVTDLIINKLDILEQINRFNIINNNNIITFNNADDFKKYINNIIISHCETVKEIKFSSSAYEI